MARVFGIFLKASLIVAALGLLAAAVGIAVARVSLPKSACTITQDQVARLELEKMTHADVVQIFGCDGVHKLVLAAEHITIEDISWRGDAWPYGVFQGHFINGVLHGTDVRWLTLNLAQDQN